MSYSRNAGVGRFGARSGDATTLDTEQRRSGEIALAVC